MGDVRPYIPPAHGVYDRQDRFREATRDMVTKLEGNKIIKQHLRICIPSIITSKEDLLATPSHGETVLSQSYYVDLNLHNRRCAKELDQHD